MRLRAVMAAFIVGCLVEFMADTALASNIAFDTAGDSAYNSGWASGSDGGYGWGSGWNISTGDGATALSADPNAGGVINSPLGLAGRSWDLSGDLTISRLFGGGLQVGQTFSIQVDQTPSGEFGVGIFFGDVFDNVSLADNGGSTYDLLTHSSTGSTTTVHTGIPVVNGPVELTFTRQDETGYVIGVTPLVSGASTSSVSADYFGGAPDGFGLGGEVVPLYFNNIEVTPEPSAICLMSLTGVGLLRRRRPFRRLPSFRT